MAVSVNYVLGSSLVASRWNKPFQPPLASGLHPYDREVLALPDDPSDPEFNRLLARAFERAWERYCSGRVTVDTETARTALAKRIVKRQREGERDEADLAADGLAYLISLTTLKPDE